MRFNESDELSIENEKGISFFERSKITTRRKRKNDFSVFSWASKHGDGKKEKKGKTFTLEREIFSPELRTTSKERGSERLTQYFQRFSNFRESLKALKAFFIVENVFTLFAQQNKRFIWSSVFTSRKLVIRRYRLLVNSNKISSEAIDVDKM